MTTATRPPGPPLPRPDASPPAPDSKILERNPSYTRVWLQDHRNAGAARLDGHDRGIKVIALALRDAGAEVIYLGLRQRPAAIVAAAVAEDGDLVGTSVQSGAHLPLAGQILAQRAEQGAGHIPVVLGGTIPAGHAEKLRVMGVDAVYPVGSPLPGAVAGLLAIAGGSGASRHRASAAAAGRSP